MQLYEIDNAISELMEKIEIDLETGEIKEGADYLQLLDSLQEERENALCGIAKAILNIRSDAGAIKAEEERLKWRRVRLESKETRLMQLLNAACGGEKKNFGVATASYRKSTSTIIENTASAVEWLEANNYQRCIKYTLPEVRKDEVKKLIKKGVTVPSCRLETGYSFSLK